MVPVAVVMTPSYGPGETTHAFDSLRRSGLHPKAHVANDDAGAVSDKVLEWRSWLVQRFSYCKQLHWARTEADEEHCNNLNGRLGILARR